MQRFKLIAIDICRFKFVRFRLRIVAANSHAIAATGYGRDVIGASAPAPGHSLQTLFRYEYA